tara:strand:- start:344 stop:517 length:174 start_codon:yes stop_codon:yes gene_type:complete
MTYKIIRCYQAVNTRSRLIKSGLTLEQAQAHCSDPNTRGVTKIRGIKTRYFDAYDKE